MLQITNRAARQLKAALSKASDERSACFRVGIADSKVQVVVDEERPGDTTIDHEGETLVVVDPTARNFLSDYELDFDDSAKQLTLNEVK